MNERWTDSETGFLVELIKNHKEAAGYSAVISPEAWAQFAITLNKFYGRGRTGASCSSRMGRVNAKKKKASWAEAIASRQASRVAKADGVLRFKPTKAQDDPVSAHRDDTKGPQMISIALKALCNGVKRLAGEMGCTPDDLLLAMIDEVAK